jgi:hypothetical protein
MMTADDGVTARQASFGGVWSRTFLRWCAVACWLSVAGFSVMVFTTGMPWWAGVLVELALLLFILPLGLVLWSDAAEHKADTERLLRNGRPAVAEVLELELIDHDDSGDVAILRLRISGDDVPPFEATYRGNSAPEFRAGARLYATVDPVDNLFTLRHLGGAPA